MPRLTPELERLATARPQATRRTASLVGADQRRALLAGIMADEHEISRPRRATAIGLLRAAFRAKTDQVPAQPVPPPHLPAWRRWLAPAVSAVLVVALIAGLAALSQAGHRAPAPNPPQQGATQSGAGIPGYYVALTFTGNGQCCEPGEDPAPQTRAVVRNTATGAVVAAITPPEPYFTFTGVTGSADDRTFVLAAQKPARLPLDALPATRLFLLRINPASRSRAGRARLTPLPIPLPAGDGVSDLALSPNGASLAAAITPNVTDEAVLHIFNLSTGADRTWTGEGVGTGTGPGLQGSLSWTADSQNLAFIWNGISGQGVRLLNTTLAGSNLLANSHLVVPSASTSSFPYWRQALITPDGNTIIAVLEVPTNPVTQKLAEFSAQTGKLLRVLNDIRLYNDYEQVQWTSATGQVLIATGTRHSSNPLNAPFFEGAAGILSGGHFTALRWSDKTYATAW
jgi:hypothetical protein